MTPKEKAEELVRKFRESGAMDEYAGDFESAKICALIAVDEIEIYRKQIENEYDEDLCYAYGVEEYWEEVKQEIEKL